jgi:hypothetical protein
MHSSGLGREMTIKPETLAETLFTELIQKRHCHVPPEVRIPPAAIPAVEAKIRLYQFSSILLAVITTAQAKPEFLPVQEHLERLFFPPTPQQGFDILLDVRGAMKDLSELLTVKNQDRTDSSSKAGKSMFWARNWLLSVGVDECNPATLALFALNWMDYYITIGNSLKDFTPAT